MSRTENKTAYYKCPVRLSAENGPAENGTGQNKTAENGLQEKNAARAEKKQRRFELAAHSGNVLEAWFGDWIIELRGMRFEEKIPVLLEHKYEKPVGVCDSVRFDDEKGLMMSGYFCDTEEAKKILSLLEQGFPYQASVGIYPDEVFFLQEKAKAEVNGKTVEGPIDIWKKSYVREVSFTALGWDANTSATLLTHKGDTMAAVNQKEGQAVLQQEGVTLSANQPEQDMQKTQDLSAANAMAATDEKALNLSARQAAEAAVIGERNRISEITALCAKFGLTELSAELAAEGCSIEAARERVLEKLSAENGKIGSAVIMEDEKDKMRAAFTDGIALSMGYRKRSDEKLAPGCEEFRNLSFQTLARNLLEKSGVKTVNMSKTDLADRILGRRNLSAATDDFKGIFMDAMNKVLIGAYENASSTWKPLVENIPASDFKTIHGIEISGGSDLLEVGENEEYKVGKFKDSRESYALSKFGRIFEVSYEMVVNDDMGALRRLPLMFANIAARNNSNVIYGLLNANPNLTDGKPLFSADRNNTGTAVGGLTSETLDLAADMLSAQKGLDGEVLGLGAKYLACAPSERIKAQILLKSAAFVGENMSAGVYNPWAESGIMPVVEERLRNAADGKKYFYLFADPYVQPVIGVSFLNGKESPDIVEDSKFNTDGFAYKVRNIMGAGIISSRGVVRMEIQ